MLEQVMEMAAEVFRPLVWLPPGNDSFIRLANGTSPFDLAELLADNPGVRTRVIKTMLKTARRNIEQLVRAQRDITHLRLVPTLQPKDCEELRYSLQAGSQPVRRPLWEANGQEPSCSVLIVLVMVVKGRYVSSVGLTLDSSFCHILCRLCQTPLLMPAPSLLAAAAACQKQCCLKLLPDVVQA